MKRLRLFATLLVATVSGASAAVSEGNPSRGQRIFGACAACHSLQPNQNMTGPSLAGLWNRKAGMVASFTRYSPALESSNIVWDNKTLDAWIENPEHLVPGNQMTFQGIEDAGQRADLLAFLKQATQPGASVAQHDSPMGGMGGGMGGMMDGARVPNLKTLDPEDRVQAISYCKETYTITTANGQTRKFWERNLRLKTDSSGDGPQKDAPALVRAGMMGDRADVIFADPSEISARIAEKC
jgi:cytochrome c